jgi:hypothetical protein
MSRPDRTAVTAAALSSVAAAATAHLLTKRASRPRSTAKHRAKTRGCEPDAGPYLEALLSLPAVDGANQGIALSMLRDIIEEEGTLPEDYEGSTPAPAPTPATAAEDPAETPPKHPDSDEDIFAAIIAASGATAVVDESFLVNVPYHEGLRSAVEVVIAVAMTLAKHDIDIDHECDDDECEASNMGPQALGMWHISQTCSRLIELAVAYERAGAEHAQECLRCRIAGHKAPFYLRARLCREVADDLLTNDQDHSFVCNGVPISTALDLAKTFIELIENLHGIPAEVQLTRLSETLASRISIRESGLGD